MGKRDKSQGAVQHRTFTRSPCTKQTSQNLVWVPKIARWEKEFCYKIGLFKWEELLEAKKLATTTFFSRSNSKVLEWNDSAAEEAFYTSKNRFFATINGLPIPEESHLLNPADLYIDHIVWSSSDDDNDDEEEEVVQEEEEEVVQEEEEEVNGDGDGNRIKPTGWDYTVQEFSAGRILTGLILSC